MRNKIRKLSSPWIRFGAGRISSGTNSSCRSVHVLSPFIFVPGTEVKCHCRVTSTITSVSSHHHHHHSTPAWSTASSKHLLDSDVCVYERWDDDGFLKTAVRLHVCVFAFLRFSVDIEVANTAASHFLPLKKSSLWSFISKWEAAVILSSVI